MLQLDVSLCLQLLIIKYIRILIVTIRPVFFTLGSESVDKHFSDFLGTFSGVGQCACRCASVHICVSFHV